MRHGRASVSACQEKKARCQGIEIDDQAIYDCVARGLCVFHGDIDTGLADYSDKSFDYVILNQSLQQVRRIEAVLKDSLRVGKKSLLDSRISPTTNRGCRYFFRAEHR